MAESSFRGDLGGLTADEMNEFLQSAPLARLATLKSDGSPYVMPVWYQWDGEAIYFVGRQRSKWCEHIKADGRVSVVIDAEHSDPDESGQSVEIPKVYMEGVATVEEEPNIGGRWVQIAEQMSLRYLGPNGPTYLVSTLQQPRWLIKMVPTHITSWKGVGWARRYWVQETGGPSYEEAHST